MSTWTGQGEINGFTFGYDVTITNSGDDLTATAKIVDDAGLGRGSAEFALSGTHEPTAGRVALAPNDWIPYPRRSHAPRGGGGRRGPPAGRPYGRLPATTAEDRRRRRAIASPHHSCAPSRVVTATEAYSAWCEAPGRPARFFRSRRGLTD